MEKPMSQYAADAPRVLRDFLTYISTIQGKSSKTAHELTSVPSKAVIRLGVLASQSTAIAEYFDLAAIGLPQERGDLFGKVGSAVHHRQQMPIRVINFNEISTKP